MVQQMRFTAIITLTQTVMSLIVLSLCAYPLSRRYLPGRVTLTIIIMFTMYFAPGVIPQFLLYKDIGLYDTVWVLILPGVFSAYNMLIIRTFFMNSVPNELEESAKIDGASHFRVFTTIWVPLSKPVFATIALFVAVARWNLYGDAMYFTNKRHLQPIQLLLYNLILNSTRTESFTSEDQSGVPISNPETMQAAAIMFATIPIMLIYPFLQKYFVKGITLGSVKG
jgi:putative aldouronate transport system permease protein